MWAADSQLYDLAAAVFATVEAGHGLDAPLWARLDETGLSRVSLPEVVHGGDGELTDAAVVLVEAGAAAARVPLVETDLLGGWLAAASGLDVPRGPLAGTSADLDVQPSSVGGSWVVTGTMSRLAWAQPAKAIVVLAGAWVIRLDPSAVTIVPGVNLADEPRDTVHVEGVLLGSEAVAQAPDGAARELQLRAALGRALLITGAARGALDAGVRYAGERVQFGRPIGRLQAVQQQLALAAAEVAAVTAATSAATRIAATHGFTDPDTAFAIAAAKARAGDAAGAVARVAHQVHGAIGMTQEHPLRLLTMRLWAWRDEDGNDAAWQAELGARVLASGGAALWPLVAGA